ncbi:MAG: Xaa-Pro peptidase family protein [Planctomycetota bacterium]|nr:Xaa-Pro peptidase family protein [Planctomycetota bacterium]
MTRQQPDLCLDLCRVRQNRVRDLLNRLHVERAVFVTPENIQYLTGYRPHRLHHAAVCLALDGQCTLAAPNDQPGHVAADRVVTFVAQHLATLRQEQPQIAMSTLSDALGACPGRTAVEFSACGVHSAGLTGGDRRALVDIDAEMWSLRRRKDADELAMIVKAIDCTEAMYARARSIIQPGISELEVFQQLHAAAVEVAGEPLTALGNDFQCSTPGGPPRDRPAQDGELYILDLGPAYRGYYADNCRTLAVNGRPTDEQHRAWTTIVSVLEMVEQTVRPNVSCRQLFATAKSMLDQFSTASFFHHLGHGIGLYPHEAPHLNPEWDDTFQEGECFTAEPGLYSETLRGGIRLEQNYLVTADGVKRLTNFPLEL